MFLIIGCCSIHIPILAWVQKLNSTLFNSVANLTLGALSQIRDSHTCPGLHLVPFWLTSLVLGELIEFWNYGVQLAILIGWLLVNMQNPSSKQSNWCIICKESCGRMPWVPRQIKHSKRLIEIRLSLRIRLDMFQYKTYNMIRWM